MEESADDRILLPEWGLGNSVRGQAGGEWSRFRSEVAYDRHGFLAESERKASPNPRRAELARARLEGGPQQSDALTRPL